MNHEGIRNTYLEPHVNRNTMPASGMSPVPGTIPEPKNFVHETKKATQNVKIEYSGSHHEGFHE